MPFQKGNKLSTGRKKGSTNRFSTNLKEDFLNAFKQLGGAKGLIKWAKESATNKRVFYQIISKMLPANLTFGTGEGDKVNVIISEEYRPQMAKGESEDPAERDIIDVSSEDVIKITSKKVN